MRFPMRADSVLILAGVLVLSACSAGDSPGAPGSSSTDRGALQGPIDPSDGFFSEKEDIERLREAAYLSANSGYINADDQLLEDDQIHPLLGNVARLHYNATRHSGYLSSIPLAALGGDLEAGGAYGSYLGNIYSWNIKGLYCAGILKPRWSVSNLELPPYNRLPSTTDTTPALNTPRNRYIKNISFLDTAPSSDPIIGGGYDVFECYIREPFVPDSFGSRVISMWLNRYGRLAMIRDRHDLWGFGTGGEARRFDQNVPPENDGAFLADGTDPMTAHGQFAGTFACRVNTSGGRVSFRPSFWPGTPSSVTGNAPITFGWSYDPETGKRVGVAIHAASNVPICSVAFEIRYTPFAGDGSPFQPTMDSTGQITATDDNNYLDGNPTPQILINGDPARPVYPITYKAYIPNCIVSIASTNGNTTDLPVPNILVDDAYQANEVVIVPQLKANVFPDGLPPGTYRVSIVVTGPPGPCVPVPPTESGDKQVRFFHVWNQASPNFFSP